MNDRNGSDQQPDAWAGSHSHVEPPIPPSPSPTSPAESVTVTPAPAAPYPATNSGAGDTLPVENVVANTLQPATQADHKVSTAPAIVDQQAAPSPQRDHPIVPPSGEEAPAKEHPKRSNGLLAGLMVGAILGAIVGGATSAVVLENFSRPTTLASTGGEITITNPESSTQVSAIAQVATPSTVTLDVSSPTGTGTGSGVIYSADGYIITNAHVVTMEGSSFANTTIRVMLSDGRILDGKVVGSAPYSDIAVVKVEADNLTPIKVAEEPVEVGDLTVAIGAPFNLSNTVTSGVVSTLNRGISVGSPLIPNDGETEQSPYEFRFETPGQEQTTGGQVTLPVIQTDASINPGNSGGPLLNASGELIGINVAIASAGQEQSQAGSVGLGFAIPVNLATRIADSIISGETPTHGLLGATVMDSRMSDTATQRGGLVREVVEGSAAAEAGIQAGDIIVAVNGILTSDGTSVSAMIRYFEGGEEVTITVMRNGEARDIDVTLGSLTD